jgi:hypothetical protein
VQVASDVGLAQVAPTVVQTGSALHVQAAVPAAPEQLWCTPQVTGAAKAQQPLVPSVHVATPPGTQEVWPCVQLLVHAAEQAAPGAAPEHDIGATHGDVETA